MTFTALVALVARLMEGLGVLTMLLGTLLTGVSASLRWRNDGGPAAFKHLRQQVGRAILLGLEFLVAADIIRTVSEVPTLTGVTVLAVIVLIRTFLSFTLQVELEGKWPWQGARTSPP